MSDATHRPQSDGSRTLARYDAPMQRTLTPREYEIAQLVARGKTNRAIAAALVVSQRTVENHLYSIYSKLGISSRTQLAIVVYQESGLAVAV
jgi:DNA-binding NarL/FixJ family response regulator